MKIQMASNHNLLNLTGRYIRSVKPHIIGVVYMELDCECIKMAGVNADGSTVLSLTLVLSKSAHRTDHPPRCRICMLDKGINVKRLTRYGVIWILQKKRKPDKKLRKFIVRELFGTRHDLAESIMLDNTN
jgi:hypothetical protein